MKCERTEIIVEGLLVEAYVGLHDPEMMTLQPIVIDVQSTLSMPEVKDDDIGNTFDYAPVIGEIRTLAKEKRRRLIETFAEEIAALCFNDAKAVSVTVSVRKPNKFPRVDAVGVTRTFVREA